MIKKIAKASSVIILICIILIFVYLPACYLLLNRKKEFEFSNLTARDYWEAVEILRNSKTYESRVKSNQEYKALIEKEINLGLYFYSEKKLVGYAGKTYALIRLIVIDSEIKGYKYCEAFVHEAIHLKEFIEQEDYVCFETFKFMYEHEELRNVAIEYGLSHIFGDTCDEINISHLIVDYLTKK